jgi:hypothetical protein
MLLCVYLQISDKLDDTDNDQSIIQRWAEQEQEQQ